MTTFLDKFPTANPVFYRTYSRLINGKRETWDEVVTRNANALAELGKFTQEELDQVLDSQLQCTALPSGRWLWVGGTDWIKKPENFSGAYNCTSTNLIDWKAFVLMMDLAMMGCGTGAVIEPDYIGNLPKIRNDIVIGAIHNVGQVSPENRSEEANFIFSKLSFLDECRLVVGDSRKGWVDAFGAVLRLSSADFGIPKTITLDIDLTNVRPAGERLKGFGGVANPVKLPDLFGRLASILAGAKGRQLTSIECCLLIDEAAAVVVAGNIRRSAGMRQFISYDEEAAVAKDNLWFKNEAGNWNIDPKRDALRMANHTRVFHHKPSLEEVKSAVSKQFYSGEGAIQFAPEAIARANADILFTDKKRKEFIAAYCKDEGKEVELLGGVINVPSDEMIHRLSRYGLNPCGEIIGSDFHCNLAEIHLNRLDPFEHQAQEQAFRCGALAVAALLHHNFAEDRYANSRELDPIVGVSFTGLFDFFVKAFGVEWLKWWQEGRPLGTVESYAFKRREQEYLERWKRIVTETVTKYCDRHGLKVPNRCTTVQPAGTKSLLTGASPGWHPPKAARYIRRITFRRDDPVALACLDFGYPVVPSQSDKDEQGNLLNDPFDPRCTEWLVELPVETPWANTVEGADQIEIHKFSALAQFDFYMQVQQHYTTHNTSATLEVRESEIEELAVAIHDAIDQDKGYISAAILARFDDSETYPRLPFEPIDKETYDRLNTEVLENRAARMFGTDDFAAALQRYDTIAASDAEEPQGPAGCDSDKCLFPLKKFISEVS